MKISIILPAYNEEKLLPSTLKAVMLARAAFERRAWESEVIVCDNHSTDRTGDIAREAGATVVYEPINQIGRARNTGASVATGDWLIFVDADSQPSAALFDAVAERIVSGKILAGGALLELDHSTPALRFLTFLWHCWSRWQKNMAGSFIFCETAAFRQIGGFNNEFFAGEELELSRQLKRLARQRGQLLEIISKPRLLTSARKARLYSALEMGRFMVRAALRPKRVLGNREACSIWYDGRR